MSVAKKASYSNEFKFKIALEAIKGLKTISELVIEHNVANSLIHKWRQQLIEGGAEVFALQRKAHTADNKEQQLYEQLGRQTMEINYLKKFVGRYQ